MLTTMGRLFGSASLSLMIYVNLAESNRCSKAYQPCFVLLARWLCTSTFEVGYFQNEPFGLRFGFSAVINATFKQPMTRVVKNFGGNEFSRSFIFLNTVIVWNNIYFGVKTWISLQFWHSHYYLPRFTIILRLNEFHQQIKIVNYKHGTHGVNNCKNPVLYSFVTCIKHTRSKIYFI